MFDKKEIITFVFGILGLCSMLSAIPRRAVKTVPILTLPRTPGSRAEQKIAFARVLQAARARGLSEIPAKSDKHVIRIATYNVDEELKAGGKLVIAVIKAVKADVIMLQGVGSHAAVLVSMLTSLGYAHYTPLKQAGDPNRPYGCMIASKIPLTVNAAKKYDRDGARFYVKIELDLKQYGKQNVVIYGVSCDSNDASV